MGLKVALLVVSLLTLAAVPATAQLADPLSLAASGVLLPFFSDSAAGFVSVLEYVSPVVPTTQGFSNPGVFNFTNPLHTVFFNASCVRQNSFSDEETAKQAHAWITTQPPIAITSFNGLAAIATSSNGNDLLPLHFPLHTRTHWIDAKNGRLRELEPIILDTFFSLSPSFLPLVETPGAGASIGLCGTPAANTGFCWSPLRSAATFVTPRDTSTVKASIILICPTADIQQGSAVGAPAAGPPATILHNGGVFPGTIFPRIVNRDGSTGFPFRSVITGNSAMTVRVRIYNDNEHLEVDTNTPCSCLTVTPVTTISSVYTLAPDPNGNPFPFPSLAGSIVPVWYTELEENSTASNVNTGIDAFSSQFSFTGYWNLEIAGTPATLFHRMSNASLDNLSFGTANPFANR
jgi:hypothetical protein